MVGVSRLKTRHDGTRDLRLEVKTLQTRVFTSSEGGFFMEFVEFLESIKQQGILCIVRLGKFFVVVR